MRIEHAAREKAMRRHVHRASALWISTVALVVVLTAGGPLVAGEALDPDTYRALSPRQRVLLLRYAASRLNGGTPVARCWAPNTPEHILLAYHAVEEASLDAISLAPRKANQFLKRWSRTATNGPGQNVQGLPVTLTWSIVPDGTPIPGEPSIKNHRWPAIDAPCLWKGISIIISVRATR